jgi:hypothetical protein
VDWPRGLCPVAEDLIPRLVTTSNMISVGAAREKAKALRRAIELTEHGAVQPMDYSEEEKRVLELVRTQGPLEPSEVIDALQEAGQGQPNEHAMFALMEGLRHRFPYKLSHAGPRKYAYHDLS